MKGREGFRSIFKVPKFQILIKSLGIVDAIIALEKNIPWLREISQEHQQTRDLNSRETKGKERKWMKFLEWGAAQRGIGNRCCAASQEHNSIFPQDNTWGYSRSVFRGKTDPFQGTSNPPLKWVTLPGHNSEEKCQECEVTGAVSQKPLEDLQLPPHPP